MLQQTTTTAVVPFFERFMKRFPSLKTLAESSIEDVTEYWAGLGYYSRARNLHKAAQSLALMPEFPRTYLELIKLPGFGPYTARAVSSLAFSEPVGVLDGNVIRVLCRFFDLDVEWWQTKVRAELQGLADEWVKTHPPEEMNQALMELGATVCIPKNPSCLTCPIQTNCLGFKAGHQLTLPKQKPRKEKELWAWTALVLERSGKIAFCTNEKLPFLKGQLLLPGQGKKIKTRPKDFDFKHAITHHDIFVKVQTQKVTTGLKNLKWIERKKIKKEIPVNLVSKALHYADKN